MVVWWQWQSNVKWLWHNMVLYRQIIMHDHILSVKNLISTIKHHLVCVVWRENIPRRKMLSNCHLWYPNLCNCLHDSHNEGKMKCTSLENISWFINTQRKWTDWLVKTDCYCKYDELVTCIKDFALNDTKRQYIRSLDYNTTKIIKLQLIQSSIVYHIIYKIVGWSLNQQSKGHKNKQKSCIVIKMCISVTFYALFDICIL